MASRTLREIAEAVGGTLIGDPEATVDRLAGLPDAAHGALSFLANKKYAPLLKETRSTAVLVERRIESAPCALIQVDHPDWAFAQAASLLIDSTLPAATPGVHPTAHVDPTATLGAEVSLGPYAIVEAGATVGDRCRLHGGAYVGPNAALGSDCILHPRATVCHGCVLGDRVILQAGAVVGSDGFGYAFVEGRHRKIEQLGIVRLGDEVELGANVTVDRARFGETVIEAGAKIDNLVQIAHNCEIGAGSILVSQVGLSGSTKLGKGVIVGGQTGFAGHLEIGDGAMFTAKCGVNKNVPPGEHWTGVPAGPHKQFLELQRNLKALKRLRELVKDLEARINGLEHQATDDSA